MAELFTVGQARAAFWAAFRQVAPEAFDELAELAIMAKEAAGGSGLIQPGGGRALAHAPGRVAPALESPRQGGRPRRMGPSEGVGGAGPVAEPPRVAGGTSGRGSAPAPPEAAFPVGSKTPEEVLERWYDLVEQAHRDGKAVNDLLVELPGPRPWSVAPWYVGPPPENRPPIEGETEAEWLDVHVKALKAYWREVERARRAEGAVPKAARETLEKHARWAALCVAGPNEDGTRGRTYLQVAADEQAASDEDVSESNVAARIAELLDLLELPHKKTGRPKGRKSPHGRG